MFDFKKLGAQVIEYILERIIDDFFSTMSGWMANIAASAAIILDMDIVVNTIYYSQSIVGSVIVVKIVYEILTTYILHQSGDSDADPGGVLIRTTETIFIIAAVPWLVRNMYLFGSLVAQDITSLPGVDYEHADNPLELLWDAYLATNPTSIILFAVGVIFGIIMLIIVVIQSFIRAGELAVLAATGCWMALSLTRQEGGLFSTWWKELVVVSMTQAVQIYLIKLAFGALERTAVNDLSFGGYVTNNPSVNLMLFLGILWVAVKAPSTLRGLVHVTGIGRVAGQGGQMLIMRKVMTRGR